MILLIPLLIILLFIGMALGVVALTPASLADQRPRLLAALLSATPSTTPTEAATETATPSETPIPPTITPTPGAERAPTRTPTTAPSPTPLPTPDDQERELYIPILMYHYISVPPADADIYRQDLSVAPENFRQQLAWLKQNGYETITLYDLIYALNIGWPLLPEKPIIITFDDGYIDNFKQAFPILQEFGYQGTFFILTDVTDRRQPGYMNWRMLREMSRAGMDIEVHGREHVEMIDRDHDWLVYHLLGPAQTIEANLGYQPRFLSYPSGLYDEAVIAAAQEQGYWGAVTTVSGTLQSKTTPFELRRLRVRGEWSVDTFAGVLEDFIVSN